MRTVPLDNSCLNPAGRPGVQDRPAIGGRRGLCVSFPLKGGHPGSVSSVEWRVVPSFPDYEASSDGRIRRISTGHQLCLLDRDGYLRANIFHEKRRLKVEAHILVCEAFHGPRPEGCEVCHNDGNGRNNAPGNLRWATHLENCIDTARHEAEKGTPLWRRRITWDDVFEIRERRAAGEPIRSITKDFPISRTHVRRIIRNEVWVA